MGLRSRLCYTGATLLRVAANFVADLVGYMAFEDNPEDFISALQAIDGWLTSCAEHVTPLF